MGTATKRLDGAFTRRLSARSFETSNPAQCAAWLRAIGYADVPTRGTEYARLQLNAGTCIIWASGLVVICLGGGQA